LVSGSFQAFCRPAAFAQKHLEGEGEHETALATESPHAEMLFEPVQKTRRVSVKNSKTLAAKQADHADLTT